MKRPNPATPPEDAVAKRPLSTTTEDAAKLRQSMAETEPAEQSTSVASVDNEPQSQVPPTELQSGEEEEDQYALPIQLRKKTEEEDANMWAPERDLKENEVAGDIVMVSQDRRNPALFLFNAGGGWRILRLEGAQDVFDEMLPWDPEASMVGVLRGIVALNDHAPADESEERSVDGVLLNIRGIGLMRQTFMVDTMRTLNSALLPVKQ